MARKGSSGENCSPGGRRHHHDGGDDDDGDDDDDDDKILIFPSKANEQSLARSESNRILDNTQLMVLIRC